MKKNIFTIFVFCILAITTFVSCKCTTSTSDSKKTSTHDCYATADMSPEPLASFTTSFFSAKLNEQGSYVDEIDTQNRTFSLKAYKDYKDNPEALKQDLYFVVRKTDGEDFFNNTAIQLCDENNQTNISLKKAKNSEYPALNITQFIHGSAIPNKPGVYRVDGFISVDDQWKLVDREMVTITD